MTETSACPKQRTLYLTPDYRGLAKMQWPHHALSGLVWAAAFLVIRLKVKGKENVPPRGPLIMVSNHMHNADPVILFLTFPRYVNFMAKENLFANRFLAGFMHWVRAFPVVKDGSIGSQRSAIKSARAILRDGLVLGMFPEGQRSRNGQLLEGQPGPIFLAMEMNAPLVPVGITGTQHLKGRGWLSRPRVSINIGQPFYLPPCLPSERKSQIPAMTRMTMEHIATLLPPEYHGAYVKPDAPL